MTEQQPNMVDFFGLAFVNMILNPIPCMDILGKFDSEIQTKMLENSLSDTELKKLAEMKGETIESIKNAVKECKTLFNINN